MTPLERWRLVLGRYAAQQLDPEPSDGHSGLEDERLDQARRMERVLDHLYGREYRGRGVLEADVGASRDPSRMTLVTWLGEVRELFPRDTAERIEGHALDRYRLTELVTDPHTLARLEPNEPLLRALLAVRHRLPPEVLRIARVIVQRVVDELRRKLEVKVRRTLTGRLHRFRHSPLAVAQNFDALGTLRKNLRHYDREKRRLVLERLVHFERNARRFPWDVVLCVDQSFSMVDSVIHSAVMAGILSALPAFRVKLVVFDSSVVDLSEVVDDPVEVLLRVQLGGGTDIAQALRYCAQLVEHPQRTVIVLVSDFDEGGSRDDLVQVVAGLAEARVRLLGLAALDQGSNPTYDRKMAERLVAAGMRVAALTPERLAEWLVTVIS